MLYDNALEVLDNRYGLDWVQSILPFPNKAIIGCAESDSEIHINHDFFIDYTYDDFDDEEDFTFKIFIGNELVADGQLPYGNTVAFCYILPTVLKAYYTKTMEIEKENQKVIYDLERKNAYFFLSLYYAVYNNYDLFKHYLKKAARKNPMFTHELIQVLGEGTAKEYKISQKLNYNHFVRKSKDDLF